MKPWSAYLFLAAIVIAIFTAPPAIAHHAIQAEYEMNQTKSFTGVMTRFAMINPHCRWFFEEMKEDGTKVTWEMSGAGPGALRAAGLVRIFQTGQVYEVTFAPAKNGANVGRVRTMKGPDGKVITLFHEDPTSPLNQ
jgi:Family of unknown function (DUF6152)